MDGAGGGVLSSRAQEFGRGPEGQGEPLPSSYFRLQFSVSHVHPTCTLPCLGSRCSHDLNASPFPSLISLRCFSEAASPCPAMPCPSGTCGHRFSDGHHTVRNELCILSLIGA